LSFVQNKSLLFECSNEFFSGFWTDAYKLGNGKISASVELSRQGIEETLTELRGLTLWIERCSLRKLLKHAGSMLDEYLNDGNSRVEIFILTHQRVGHLAKLVDAEDRKDHRDAVCDEAEPPHGGEEVVAQDFDIAILDFLEHRVELLSLRSSDAKHQRRTFQENLVKVVILFAKLSKMVVNGRFIHVGEYIVPHQINIETIEDETAEQAVFSIRDEALDLVWCAGQEDGQPRF